METGICKCILYIVFSLGDSTTPTTTTHQFAKKALLFLRIAWLVLASVTVFHQAAEFAFHFADDVRALRDTLHLARIRVPQILSYLTVFCYIANCRKKDSPGGYSLRKEMSTICGSENYCRIRSKARKFELLWCICGVFLNILIYAEFELMWYFTDPATRRTLVFWPFPSNVRIPFWAIQLIYMIPEITTLLAQLVITEFMADVYFEILGLRTISNSLNELHSKIQKKVTPVFGCVDEDDKIQVPDSACLHGVVQLVKQEFRQTEKKFSGALLCHLSAAIVSTLSLISDFGVARAPDGSGSSENLFTQLVNAQLLMWSALILLCFPTVMSIWFNDSVNRFIETMETVVNCCLNKHRLPLNIELLHLKIDMNHVVQNPLSFSALGFFYIDRRFAATVLGFLTTYALVFKELLAEPVINSSVTEGGDRSAHNTSTTATVLTK